MVTSVDEGVAGEGGLDAARHATGAIDRRKAIRQRERLMANVLSLGLAGASQELVRRNPIIIRAPQPLKIERIAKIGADWRDCKPRSLPRIKQAGGLKEANLFALHFFEEV
jgi:hypothetical protein